MKQHSCYTSYLTVPTYFAIAFYFIIFSVEHKPL